MIKRKCYCNLSGSYGSLKVEYDSKDEYLSIRDEGPYLREYIKLERGDIRKLGQILIEFADELDK